MMSTTITRPPDHAVDMVIDLDVGPRGLDRYLELVKNRPGPRIKYRLGNLTLVSPSHVHERGADRLDGLVKAIGGELDIAYHATGSTLYRRSGFDHGIEADKTYYIAHEAAVRGVQGDIDLMRSGQRLSLVSVGCVQRTDLLSGKTIGALHAPYIPESRFGPRARGIDPPPDLVIEVVVTHGPAKSLAICQE